MLGNTTSRLDPAERSRGRRTGAPALFRTVVHIEGGVVRVCPFGEVDIDTAGQICEQLENATATGAKHLVLDLRGVTFLNSTGLHLAIEAGAVRGTGMILTPSGPSKDVAVSRGRRRRAAERPCRPAASHLSAMRRD